MFHESVCVGPNRQLNYELKTYERAHLSHELCFLKINIANPAEFQLLYCVTDYFRTLWYRGV